MLWLKGVASLAQKRNNDIQAALVMLSIIWHQHNQTKSLSRSIIGNCDGNNSSQNTQEQISGPSKKKILGAFISSVIDCHFPLVWKKQIV